MNKVRTVIDLLNMASESYKQKVAISNEENINFFSHRFDVFALAIALGRVLINSEKPIVTIMSENRVEWIDTYLANIIMGNDVIILPSDLKIELLSKLINKYKVNTIFYSNSYRTKVIKLLKDRKIKRESIKLNLINFDQEKNLNVIDYQKILDAGRYLENSLEIYQDDSDEGKTIIATSHNRVEEFDSNQIIENALNLIKKVHIWNFWNKKITATHNINSEYDVYIEIIVPLIIGNTLNYNFSKSKSRDLVIQKSNMEFCEISKRMKTYKIWKEDEKMLISASKRKKEPKFEIFTNTQIEKITKPKYKENFILIK